MTVKEFEVVCRISIDNNSNMIELYHGWATEYVMTLEVYNSFMRVMNKPTETSKANKVKVFFYWDCKSEDLLFNSQFLN